MFGWILVYKPARELKLAMCIICFQSQPQISMVIIKGCVAVVLSQGSNEPQGLLSQSKGFGGVQDTRSTLIAEVTLITSEYTFVYICLMRKLYFNGVFNTVVDACS